MSGPFFGVPLRVLCERDAVEVPLLLGDLLRWLATHALSTPDAFAQPAKSCATSQLKGAIDSGVPVADLLDSCQPATVGSLLKLWLQDLPDPLLNWDEQVELLSACKDEGSIEQRVSALNDGLAMIDHYTLSTLKPLLLFLQQYCFRQRRFDCQLLQVAVAMAPILFPAALAAGAPELRLAEETVATLVSNALHVFNPALAVNVPVVTPQALCEAAAEMQQQQDEAEQVEMMQCEAPPQMQQHQDVSYQYTSHTFCADGSSSSAAVAAAGEVEGGAAAQPALLGHPAAADSDDYEPYLYDGAFLASLNSMVCASITDALFGGDDDDEAVVAAAEGSAGLAEVVAYESVAAAWALAAAAEEDCCAASDASSWSATQILSSGGADSSAGSSRSGSGGGEEQQQQRAQPLVVIPAPPQGLSGDAFDLAPYSPNAVLVTPGPAAAEDPKASSPSGGDSKAAAAAVAAAAGVISAAVAAVAAKTSTASAAAAAVLAELARRDIGAGSGAFCVISTQPPASPKTTPTTDSAAVLPAANTNKQGAALQAPSSQLAKKQKPLSQSAQPQPLSRQLSPLQIEMAEYLQEQEALIGGPAPATPRRITEGGAGSVPPSPSHSGPRHAHHASNAIAARALSRLAVASSPTAADAAASRQRRMTMGGGSNGGAPADAPRSPASSGGGAAAAASPRHHGHHGHAVHYTSVQIPRRQTMGGRRSSGGGGSSGGGARRSSGGGSASPACGTLSTPLAPPSPALTTSPTAGAGPASSVPATSTAAPGTAGVVELGCAGHFAVALNTCDKTLAVRELRTPEAQAHRVPIRSLTQVQQQQEKERLKRQLKDVSHAFEALAGQPLTPALKEPLRPVYVRYHKIKALLGAAAAGSGGKVGAVKAAAGSLVLSTPPAAVVL
ncbi:hypothetical protein HYH02_002085 [Chlamydomonas schloesseri]|uniref:Rho-GAP domain-containing protein n=1 Tax=Chlamydomonas schloesseri TaxID=2026947 RepID=A0A836BCK7_9CHLO|nr:hypothetical protein HYH02_002085 [Chlamydomonas schloesseri]|eukprot:KAG2453879.1 hypothetical protein HYH02_002085 [Chlamydomonas schloesseri]